jgi:hypothetical protein
MSALGACQHTCDAAAAAVAPPPEIVIFVGLGYLDCFLGGYYNSLCGLLPIP